MCVTLLAIAVPRVLFKIESCGTWQTQHIEDEHEMVRELKWHALRSETNYWCIYDVSRDVLLSPFMLSRRIKLATKSDFDLTVMWGVLSAWCFFFYKFKIHCKMFSAHSSSLKPNLYHFAATNLLKQEGKKFRNFTLQAHSTSSISTQQTLSLSLRIN